MHIRGRPSGQEGLASLLHGRSGTRTRRSAPHGRTGPTSPSGSATAADAFRVYASETVTANRPGSDGLRSDN